MPTRLGRARSRGVANVDVDMSTGVASYTFPEFVPRTIGGESLL